MKRLVRYCLGIVAVAGLAAGCATAEDEPPAPVDSVDGGAEGISDSGGEVSQVNFIQSIIGCMAKAGFVMPDPIELDGQLGFDPRDYPDDPGFESQEDTCYAEVAAALSGGPDSEVPLLDEAGELQASEIATATYIKCMNERGFESTTESSEDGTYIVFPGVTDYDDPVFVEAGYACSDESAEAQQAFRLDQATAG